MVDRYAEEGSGILFVLDIYSSSEDSLREDFFFIPILLFADEVEEGLASDIFPNVGFDSSAFASFCCFQLGVFQLGAFSSVGFAGAAVACFFHEGTFLSGGEAGELSGAVAEGVFHDGAA